MRSRSYSCVKCSGTEYKTGELRTTGSGLSRFFNIQNQKYATVACTVCGYTELYRLGSSGMDSILQIFTN